VVVEEEHLEVSSLEEETLCLVPVVKVVGLQLVLQEEKQSEWDWPWEKDTLVTGPWQLVVWHSLVFKVVLLPLLSPRPLSSLSNANVSLSLCFAPLRAHPTIEKRVSNHSHIRCQSAPRCTVPCMSQNVFISVVRKFICHAI